MSFCGRRFDSDYFAEAKLLEDFLLNENYYSQSVYEDSLEVLKAIRKLVEVGIFSEGDPDFQKNKLVRSGLLPLFEPKHMYIFERKLLPGAISKLP